MANKIFWSKTSFTGGGATALDSIDGDNLTDGDFATVTVSGVHYLYKLDADSAATEASPSVIAPDANAGDKRWILQGGRTGHKIGSFTHQNSAGAQAITGVGFMPSAVFFFQASATNIYSFGMDNLTSCGCVGQGTTGNLNSTSYSIVSTQNTGVSVSSKLSALGADGFTLTATVAGSPATFVVQYIAFA